MINNYYVPILKWKRGEQIAIRLLDTNSKHKLLPLIEIPPVKYSWSYKKTKRTLEPYINGVVNSIYTSFGSIRVFLDLVNIYQEGLLSNGEHPIENIVNQGSKYELTIVPVVKENSDKDYVKAIQNLLKNKVINEICIRIEKCDFKVVNNTINNILKLYSISSAQCHIVIDLKEKTIDDCSTYEVLMPALINNLVDLYNWETITLTVTSFPMTLEKVSRNSYKLLPRIEFNLWKNIYNNPQLQRKIQFGDYCISNPQYIDIDPKKIKINANIRYTISDYYLVCKGIDIKMYGLGQMFDLCSWLINSGYYLGQSYCWGDRYIYDVVNNNKSTGSPEIWHRVGTNHHIQFVVNELSDLFYF